jgi:DNA primase
MASKRAWSVSQHDKVEALKRVIDLRDLFLERYPDRFRRSGRWLYGASPYRPDRHPSFAVNEDVYIDFATGERGDEVDFIRREQGVSFADAVAVLEARASGAALSPNARPQSPFNPSPSEPPPSVWQAVMRDLCKEAHAYLFSSDEPAQTALHWLQARGLTLETIRQAQLGCNPAWRRTPLWDSQGRKRVSIAPGILIPCSVSGALWAVHVRTLPALDTRSFATYQPLPKYLYVRGSKSSVLYNGDALRDGCTALIVEGEFDALLAQQELGAQAVVVTLGSAANTLPRRWLARLKAADKVYSCLDNDAAGRRASTRLSEWLGEQHQALKLPQGKDITEFMVVHGGDLEAWWHQATAPDLSKAVQLSLSDAFAALLPDHGSAEG